ncbi:hypothetical protein DVH24_006220 [Malus domestica]|uniref:Uncharacterized protein n=1 Tax=Malus domestica TaxID=3750 RepID=A0A498KHK3_MALDO|nr:hypothetical protein DVH24_006220 [Malus domestica]
MAPRAKLTLLTGGNQVRITRATLGSFVLLLLVIAAYHAYSTDKTDYKDLKPSTYSHADIKRFTNKFKYKLGQGAYRIVFKGKLFSEYFVAMKVLNISKGDGFRCGSLGWFLC